MAGASQESLVKKGLDAALHQHYGSAMVPNYCPVSIGNAEIFPLLATHGVRGNCAIGQAVCTKVYGREYDASLKRREDQWNIRQTRKYVCLYCTMTLSGGNGPEDAQSTFLKHAAKCTMAKCKAHMGAPDFERLHDVIKSVVQAEKLTRDKSTRDIIVGLHATLGRVEAKVLSTDARTQKMQRHVVEVVVDKRKREEGDKHLSEAKRICTEAQYTADRAASREEASLVKQDELDRKQAELDTKKAELDEQAQRGGVGGHDVHYSNWSCLACNSPIAKSCKDSNWTFTEAVTCGDVDHYICAPCYVEFKASFADNGNVCQDPSCGRPLKIANSAFVSTTLHETFAGARVANATQQAEREMTVQNNKRTLEEIAYDRCLQLLDTHLTQFCPTCFIPCQNDERGCDTMYCQPCKYTFCTICGYGMSGEEIQRFHDQAAAEGREYEAVACPVHEHCRTAREHGNDGEPTDSFYNIQFNNGKKWMRVHSIRRAARHLEGLDDAAQVRVLRKLYRTSVLVTKDDADSILRTLGKEPHQSYSPSPSPAGSPLLAPTNDSVSPLRPDDLSPEVIELSDSDSASADKASADNASADNANADNATADNTSADNATAHEVNANADQAPPQDVPAGAPLQAPPVPGLYRNDRHFNSHTHAQEKLMDMGFDYARTTALLRELIEVDADELFQFALNVLLTESN